MTKTKFVFDQANDGEYASQEELDQVKDNNTSTFDSNTMNNKSLYDLIYNGNAHTFKLEAARDKNVTNSYLMTNLNFTNLIPFVMPFDCKIIAIAAASLESATWIAEVHSSGVLVSGAALSISAVQYDYSSFDVNLNAGDTISLYCNGISIKQPHMDVYIIRR